MELPNRLFMQWLWVSRTTLVIVFVGVVGALVFPQYAGRALWEYARAGDTALFVYKNATFAVELGNYYFNTEGDGEYDLEKAKEFYEKALALDPQAPDAWHQLARIDFLNGEFDGAIEKINTQLALHGDSLMASYYIRGLISGFRKEYRQAEDDFKTFLTWDTKNWAAHNDLAWIYFEQGKFEEAEEIARAGLVHNSSNPWLRTSRGVSLMNLGRGEEAEVELERALAEARLLTPYAWERAYPGNDPRIAPAALEQMIAAIEQNLELLVHK